MISITRAKRRLARLWAYGAGFIVVLMFAETLAGFYAEHTATAWGWAAATILPFLCLVISATVIGARADHDRDRYVEGQVFVLVWVLSFLYLSICVGTIFLQVLSEPRPTSVLERSILWFGPLEGLVGIALGVFFTKEARASD